MEMFQVFQGINWLELGKTGGYYLFFFIFYILLIQTTIVATIKSISSIFYQADTNVGSEVMAAAVLWSMFILMHL